MKYISTFILASILVLLSFINVFASCSIWRNGDIVTVNKNVSITGEKAPKAAIGYSTDHTEDLSFTIELLGAEWDYSGRGTIQTGVTYSIDNKNLMTVYVDVGTNSNEHNFTKRSIYIPLYSTPTQGGEIRFRVDGTDSTVSNATITYAKCIDGLLKASAKVANISNIGELRTITIDDTSTQIFKKNSIITLEIDSGFKFTNTIEPTGIGKFEGKCTFSIDSKDKSKAYIKITEETPSGSGKIILDGIVIEKSNQSKFNAVIMNVSTTASIVKLDTSFTVAKYNSEATYTTTAETTTEATTETTTETTTEATTEVSTVVITETAVSEPITADNKNIVISIGADHYTVGNVSYSLDAPAYIDNGYTMLPLRALANSLGISDENISYDSEAKTVILTHNSSSVAITAGEAFLSLNDLQIPIDCPAQITNSRLFLPVRAIANALGVSNENIKYDSSSKTVTIIR